MASPRGLALARLYPASLRLASVAGFTRPGCDYPLLILPGQRPGSSRLARAAVATRFQTPHPGRRGRAPLASLVIRAGSPQETLRTRRGGAVSGWAREKGGGGTRRPKKHCRNGFVTRRAWARTASARTSRGRRGPARTLQECLCCACRREKRPPRRHGPDGLSKELQRFGAEGAILLIA